MFLLFVIVVVSFALYSMKPEERVHALRLAVAVIRQLKGLASRQLDQPDPLADALRARTPWPFVTAALVLVSVVTFFRMALADGSVADPATQLAWGANFGPLTTNGEWWRLVASSFIHTGLLQLIVFMAALAQVGLLLERLVGHTTFGLVYVTAAVFGSAMDLYAHPLSIGAGASGGVMGVYGLLVAATFWSLLPPSAVTIPVKGLARFAPTAVVFLLYSLLAGNFASKAPLVTFGIGLVAGLALTKGIGEHKPSLRLLGPAAAAALVLAAVVAFPLRGISDVRPEIERIVALESRTAGLYETAVIQFRLGAIKAEALAQIIDRSIMPELHAAQGRMKAFEGDNVPTEYRPLVEGANEYLRLRDESWRLRAEALRKADRSEWASLEAFGRIKPVENVDKQDKQDKQEEKHQDKPKDKQ